MTKKNAKRYFFIALGSISFVLGFIGVFLPVLPTTPFILLAAYCYARSSEKLSDWLLNKSVFSGYLRDYLKNRAIRKNIQIFSLLTLWLTLFISIVLISNPYLKVFLLVVGLGVSIHLLSLKTLKTRS